jgi:hypothetical protein
MRSLAEGLATRIRVSAAATAASIAIGVIPYLGWSLLALYVSLQRSTSSRAQEMPIDLVLKWWNGLTFLLALALLVLLVRMTMKWLGRARHAYVSPMGVSMGAVIGTVLGLFLNRSLSFSRAEHLFIGIPDRSLGLFWLLVPGAGWTFAMIGSGVRGRPRSSRTAEVAMSVLILLLPAIIWGGVASPCAMMLEGQEGARDHCIAQEMGKLGDTSVAPEAIRTLAGIGIPAVKPLIGMLRQRDEVVRASAIDALGRIAAKQSAAADIVPEITKALKDESTVVRRQAAGALGRQGVRPKSALPALNAAQQDSDLVVRELASFAIRMIEENRDRSPRP